MKKISYIVILFLVSSLFVFESCTKNWVEMNTNPNEPTEAPTTNILAHTIRHYVANNFNDVTDMDEASTYSGHLSKIQYIDESLYRFRESNVNNIWECIYLNVFNLEKIIDIESDKDNGNPIMKAAAITFRAYIYQMGTDRFKNMPYFEACTSEDDNGTFTPAYDSQEDIYNDLFVQLEAANALFYNPDNIDYDLGNGDILFDNKPEMWQKFCNSLRLRLAIRVSNIAPSIAQTQIETVLGNPSKYPIFGADENAFLNWPGVAPYKEPWYSNKVDESRDEHGLANTLIDSLIAYNDPRIAVYAKPLANGSYFGGIVGDQDGSQIGCRLEGEGKGI